MKFIPYAALGLVGLFVISSGWNIVNTYSTTVSEKVRLERELARANGTLESYRRMVVRRDDAINQSKCKAQITAWIKDPSTLPAPFKPFGEQTNGR